MGKHGLNQWYYANMVHMQYVTQRIEISSIYLVVLDNNASMHVRCTSCEYHGMHGTISEDAWHLT